VTGTLFGNANPRLVDIFGVKIEADLRGPMLYIVNRDEPGFIGRLGSTLGEASVNIGTFHLGRRNDGPGGDAVLLLSLDSPVEEPVLWKVCQLPGVRDVKALNFA
jgi:D-3-phosphoglycerate dehydrogenase